MLLLEVSNIKDLHKNLDSLASLILSAYEIILRNQNRAHLVWTEFTGFLVFLMNYTENYEKDERFKVYLEKNQELFKKLNEKIKPIAKGKANNFKKIQNYSWFSGLNLCLKFCDKCNELLNFEAFLKLSLEFLNDASLPVINDLIKIILDAINSFNLAEKT